MLISFSCYESDDSYKKNSYKKAPKAVSKRIEELVELARHSVCPEVKGVEAGDGGDRVRMTILKNPGHRLADGRCKVNIFSSVGPTKAFPGEVLMPGVLGLGHGADNAGKEEGVCLAELLELVLVREVLQGYK